MGLLNPFWWIMHELAWSCQPSWSASSYGSSDPNKEGTAVASWLLPQQASCLTSVFEKPYWSWAGIPWNGLLPATSSFVNPSWQSPNTGSKAFLWLRDPRNGSLCNTRDKLSLFWASDKSLSDLGGTIRVCSQETFWAQTHCFMVLTPKHNSPPQRGLIVSYPGAKQEWPWPRDRDLDNLKFHFPMQKQFHGAYMVTKKKM